MKALVSRHDFLDATEVALKLRSFPRKRDSSRTWVPATSPPRGDERTLISPWSAHVVRYEDGVETPRAAARDDRPRPKTAPRGNELPLHRQAPRAQGGRAAHHRPRPLQRRFQRRRPSLRGDAALPACARAHPRHRCEAGHGDARGARRLHRRRLPRRRAWRHSARSAAQDQIRHEAACRGRRRALHRPAPPLARRQGAPCGRGGGDGGGRDSGASARRGGMRRRRLRRPAGRLPFARRHAAGRARGLERGGG